MVAADTDSTDSALLEKAGRSIQEYMFCLSWMLLILFFLSLLPEKKTRYLLPILLPAALTMGYLFVYWIQQAKQKMPHLKDRVIYRINAYLIVVATLALPLLSISSCTGKDG